MIKIKAGTFGGKPADDFLEKLVFGVRRAKFRIRIV